MHKKFSLCILVVVCVSMLAFLLDKSCQSKTVIVPPFPVFNHDSLGVYRVVGTDVYASKHNKVRVTISYIQLGDSESLYELKLNNGDGCYGDVTYEEDGSETGYFYHADSPVPIVYKNNGESNIYIIINKKKIPISYCNNYGKDK